MYSNLLLKLKALRPLWVAFDQPLNPSQFTHRVESHGQRKKASVSLLRATDAMVGYHLCKEHNLHHYAIMKSLLRLPSDTVHATWTGFGAVTLAIQYRRLHNTNTNTTPVEEIVERSSDEASLNKSMIKSHGKFNCLYTFHRYTLLKMLHFDNIFTDMMRWKFVYENK